jgi:hypothetical protein
MLRSGRAALSVPLAALLGVLFGFEVGFWLGWTTEVAMIIGLFRPSETDCGLIGVNLVGLRPRPADVANREGVVGCCVSDGVIVMVRIRDDIADGFAGWMLEREGRAEADVSWPAL